MQVHDDTIHTQVHIYIYICIVYTYIGMCTMIHKQVHIFTYVYIGYTQAGTNAHTHTHETHTHVRQTHTCKMQHVCVRAFVITQMQTQKHISAYIHNGNTKSIWMNHSLHTHTHTHTHQINLRYTLTRTHKHIIYLLRGHVALGRRCFITPRHSCLQHLSADLVEVCLSILAVPDVHCSKHLRQVVVD